jgi:hypothetical protein
MYNSVNKYQVLPCTLASCPVLYLKQHAQVLSAAVYSGEVFRTIFATIKAGFRGGIV